MNRRDFVKALVASGAMVRGHAAHAWPASSQPDHSVKRVLVMFKCHFDAGFIDTQKNVVHKYFTQYYPQAIEVAARENAGGRRRYVWTTGSWLLFEYLEQASAPERKRMEDAIVNGDIAWHALPFTWQSELLDPSMIEGSLALANSLDRRFGCETTGAKLTDVPGHTLGIIGPLVKHGVSFLEIGVNSGSTPAELPPLFNWRDAESNLLTVMYHHDYGGIARVPGSDLVLVTCVRDDNSGPHTPAEISTVHSDLATRFPNAEIIAANLSEMANALEPYRSKLPVITEEIGDTWIYGAPSDPLKVTRYRAVARLRRAWLERGAFQVGDHTDMALLRRVLLEVEHTWGTDTKTWLDFDNYTPSDLKRMLSTPHYQVVQYSWAEKRQDLFQGVSALPAGLREECSIVLDELTPRLPHSPENAVALSSDYTIQTDHHIIGLDKVTGAITRLCDKRTGREWASPANTLALLTYQTLSKEDYDRFIAAYLTTKADWAPKDFGKPNIERFGARNQTWLPRLISATTWEDANAQRVLLQLEFEDEVAIQAGRAAFPSEVRVELVAPRGTSELHIHANWSGKPATRLPEALWLTFDPVVEDQNGWYLEKTGQTISPFDVVPGGGRHMHSLSRGFGWRTDAFHLAIETVDAPVVALGHRTPLTFSKKQANLAGGVHSCLFNNAWGTNYIMWYGEDAQFRYILHT